MSDASKKKLPANVQQAIDDAFDGYNGPFVLPEENLFWDMMKEGIPADNMSASPYFIKEDYPDGIADRFKAFLIEEGKSAIDCK